MFIEGGTDSYYWRQPLTNETYSAEDGDYIWVRLYHEWWSAKEPKWEQLYNWIARRMYTISLRGAYSGVQVDEIFISNDINDAPHDHSYSETYITKSKYEERRRRLHKDKCRLLNRSLTGSS